MLVRNVRNDDYVWMIGWNLDEKHVYLNLKRIF